ncbi:MAG TPA: 3-dehydroquinate synthase [Hyphomicrobiaceae bacterium]|nr:3-dehydroquinate synthase [Hyphomicrobiaceae bacterium]
MTATAPTKSSADAPAVVPVALGARSYEVLIGSGLLARAADLIGDRLGRARCAVVTDENIAPLLLAPLEQRLKDLNRHAGSIVLAPGEASKSFPVLSRLCEGLLESGIERGDAIIALGGGVIGDLTGFAASIVRRGVRLVQVPTTLLAQVDSSVGGKTGINTPQGKNLIGTFHQPSLVLADVAALSTLSDRQFRAGYVEAAKFGLLGDAAFFAWLERNLNGVMARQPDLLASVVETAVRGKAGIVARDETETGERMLLNLGHTFGHALEAWAGFSDRLLHGEAIAIGICLAFRLSQELGLVGADATKRVEAHFAAAGLPTRIADVPGGAAPEAAALMAIMQQDKKVQAGQLTLILVRGLGHAFVTRDVAQQDVQSFLARNIGTRRP